ncbi:aldo/keto reductase [Flavobacterium flavigenum]|uniref:aldo/keto reductase n=1 Tax=Flavobacterium flavigenum TaxID=3003258 RepID=UPI0022AC2ACF|nr:aldo/keto reductase [Flavobacterium flavigenum]
MNYKLLGKRTGLPVSEFTIGAGNFGQAWGYGMDSKEADRIVSFYTEHGVNLIDTSDTYQCGESEILVKAIASKRNDLVITTKYTRGIVPEQALGKLGNHRKNMVQQYILMLGLL